MKSVNILVVGSTGFVGKVLKKYFESNFIETRPPKCTLNSKKIQALLDFKLLEVPEGVKLFKSYLINQNLIK